MVRNRRRPTSNRPFFGPLGCLWAIIKTLLLIGGFILIGCLSWPWAVPLPGRDTLTGRWVGEVRSSSGSRAWLYVYLDFASGYTVRFGSASLADRGAALCTSRRRIDLSVRGSTTTWSGRSVDLLLTPIQPNPPELRFDVDGTWDGHTLELRESDHSLAEALNEPAAEPPGSPRWIAATLRRGTRSEFDAACAALGGRK